MANFNFSESEINNSWSLIDFAKSHGKMHIGEFINKNTGEIFKFCIFTDPISNTNTFVSFATKLGPLTPKEIADRKDDLQVVQLGSGTYKLCNKGRSAWEEVNLDL